MMLLTRIRHLVSQKSGITYVISHNCSTIKVDSKFASRVMSLEKALTLNDVIILIKSLFDKNQNNYYYNIHLKKKCLYQLAKNNDNFLDSITMLNFRETKVAKGKLCGAKKSNKYLGC